MSRHQIYDWNDNKVIDDVEFQLEDASIFKTLLGEKEDTAGEGSVASMSTGEILKGIIVEVTRDFVVVDVGLKSEGLIPIAEFGDSDDITLGKEIEVYLDQTEGNDGQIVLSREKARKQRQWEYIINHCQE